MRSLRSLCCLWLLTFTLIGCDSYWDYYDSYDYWYEDYSGPSYSAPANTESYGYQYKKRPTKEFLQRHFELRYRDNVKNPAETTDKIWPFAALLEVSGTNTNLCTATHIEEGLVVTAAHCVRRRIDLSASNYFLIFFDKNGKKQVHTISEFGYVGSETSDDIAYLKIAPTTSQHWHVWDGELDRTTESDIGARPPELANVALWSFDPYGLGPTSLGAALNPRTCLASRTKPMITRESEKDVDHSAWDGVRFDESEHVFMDHCDRPVIQGNSGALITNLKTRTMIGVTQAYIGSSTPQSSDESDVFYYVGNLMKKELTEKLYNNLFTLGTVIDKSRMVE